MENFTGFDKLFKYNWLNHLLFWVCMILVLAYHSSLFGGAFLDNLINMLIILPFQILAAYTMVYYQIPKWLFQGKWVLFILSMVFIAYLICVLTRLSIIYIAEPLIGREGVDESVFEIMKDPWYLLKVYTPAVYLPTVILFLLKMTKERFLNSNRIVALQKEKTASELKFLKAQMNPHFLFNTLNGIYALSRSKAEETPEMILKLSSILNYTLYECTVDAVPIVREWELIENYVDLELMRRGEHLSVTINQSIENKIMEMAPLILIGFVENAFKHLKPNEQGIGEVSIELRQEKKTLSFDVSNTVGATENLKSKNGIGMKNMRQQLDILYPNRYSLNINREKGRHTINLTIQL